MGGTKGREGGRRGGGPNTEKCGVRRVGVRRVGAEGWGARKGGGPNREKGWGARRVGGPKGWGGPKFRVFFFFLLPLPFLFSLSGDVLVSFLLSPGVFSCLFSSL